MTKVVVVTTKPGLNEAEYGIQNPDGSFAIHGELIGIDIHGERIGIDISSLSEADQSSLADARAVLLRLATEDAKAKNLI